MDALQVNNLSEGSSNILTVEFITAILSLDTHPGELVHFEQDDENIYWLMVYDDTVIRW